MEVRVVVCDVIWDLFVIVDDEIFELLWWDGGDEGNGCGCDVWVWEFEVVFNVVVYNFLLICC